MSRGKVLDDTTLSGAGARMKARTLVERTVIDVWAHKLLQSESYRPVTSAPTHYYKPYSHVLLLWKRLRGAHSWNHATWGYISADPHPEARRPRLPQAMQFARVPTTRVGHSTRIGLSLFDLALAGVAGTILCCNTAV